MKIKFVLGSLVLGASLCGQSFGGDLLSRLLGGHGCGAKSSCCDTSVSDPSCGAEMASPCGLGNGAGPSCGAEMASPCGSGYGAGPSCGAEMAGPSGLGCAAPSCGAEIASSGSCGTPSCGSAPHRPLFGHLKGKLSNLKGKLACKSACASGCSDPIGPSCGAELASPCGLGNAGPSCGAEIAACDPYSAAPSCDSGCGAKKHCGLLAKIFSHKKKSCDSGACDSYGSPVAAGCSSCGGTAVSAPLASPIAAPAPVVDPHAYMNTKRHVIQASNTRIR